MTRLCAITAPLLMLLYGVLRWFDGRDGHHDHTGALWRIGHVAFFLAIVLFGLLAYGLSRSRGTAATVAAVATWAGGVCFLWVIAGDLSPRFHDAAPLPGVLQNAGPALFEIGLLALLVMQVVARRLPVYAPVLVLLGFAAIVVDLDLLPLGSILVGLGLLPLAAGERRQPVVAGR